MTRYHAAAQRLVGTKEVKILICFFSSSNENETERENYFVFHFLLFSQTKIYVFAVEIQMFFLDPFIKN